VTSSPLLPAPTRGAGSLPFLDKPAGTANDEMPFDHIVVVMMENHKQIDDGLMTGFITTATNGSSEAMGCYTPTVLPFAHSLASTFTVANRWFCSVSGPTYPNRRFLLAGTAWGLTATDVAQSALHPSPPNGAVFDRLSHYRINWADYFTDVPMSLITPSAFVKHFDHHHLIEKFFHDCAAGTLPAVSFVDPREGVLSSIARSVASLSPIIKEFLSLLGVTSIPCRRAGLRKLLKTCTGGEAWAHRVIEAVLQSPKRDRTLLIYTYDEHGGYYDHVASPRAIAPDNIAPSYPPPQPPSAYDSYGPRVPAVVASAYSRPGAVTNVIHDHTSILATIWEK
jgi:phospholipase C